MRSICRPSSFTTQLLVTSLSLLWFTAVRSTLAEPCIPRHRDALLSLKQGFNTSVNSKSMLLSWVPNTDCCRWQGVTCNDFSGEVTGLHLGKLSISGTVEPDALFDLSSLTSLDLSFNSLNFSRVSLSSRGFDVLANLNYLNLSTSGFEGQIPGEIGKLTKLVSLDFSNIYKHPVVKIEDPNLETILRNLCNLEELYLDNVNVPDAACCPTLYSLLPKLRAFRMPCCSLSRPIVAPVSRPRYLTERGLKTNDMSSTQPNVLQPYGRQIRYFLASGNFFRGSIPSSICRLSSLEVLDLSENQLGGQIPHCLAQLSSLIYLNLRGNKLQGTLPPTFFGSNCSLQTLDLNSNQLNGRLPMTLSNCKALEFVNLGNNSFNGTFPQMNDQPELRVLILTSNKLQGTLESLNINSSKLQILDLSSNNFSGTLQSHNFLNWKAMMTIGEKEDNITSSANLGYYKQSFVIICKGSEMRFEKVLKRFIAINLANNKFQGSIPDSIAKLSSLYLLNLSHNGLFGPIPASFGQLQQLESLDLSWNKLNGEIPYKLTLLHFLSFLNLSYNSLSGMIPHGSQFDTFTDSCYIGNDNLCGAPVLRECRAKYETNNLEHNHSNFWLEHNMVYICFAFGFCGGHAFAVAFILLWNTGKGWRHVDKVLYKALLSHFYN